METETRTVKPDLSDREAYGLPEPRPVQGQVVRQLPNQQQAEPVSILRFSQDGLGELFAALSAAQGEFGTIERTLRADIKSKRTGAEYSYEYAPLADVLAAVRPALSKVGLSIQQFPAVGNGFVIVKTLLGHKSGSWMSNDLRLPCDTSGPQECASGITFARRYSVMPIVGVAPEKDDDGKAASPKGEPPRPGQRRPQASSSQPEPAAASEPARPAAKPARPAAPPAATPGPEKTSSRDQAAPTAANPVAPSGPAPVGRIVELVEKPNGCIAVLDTGFRAAAKEAKFVGELKAFVAVKARVKISTVPSSDPNRFAPVVTKIEIVKGEPTEREPGQEG